MSYLKRWRGVDSVVAKQTYRTPELCRRYQRIFIHQFRNFR